MPIKFRCRHCQQFLGISDSRAGEITNCPQCGKAIRVPALDGTVAPIPEPKLNLKDEQLADALSELARLESDSEENLTKSQPIALPELQSNESRVSTPPAREVTAPVTVLAKPVAESARKATLHPTSHTTPIEEDSHEVLSSLADLAGRSTSSTSSRIEQNNQWKLLVPVLGFLLLLTIAVMMRSGFGPDASSIPVTDDSQDTRESEPEDQQPANLPNDVSVPAITGRVTYISDAGDSRPDSGAIAILLPFPRKGQFKLDEAGFLSGAAQIDADAATAALQALGGDASIADQDGKFELHVTTAGDYRMLVISHHQKTNTRSALATKVQETLSGYFLRPAILLGQLSYHFDDFHYRGQGTSPRDVNFAQN
ncbi:MAG: hypothetical protein R3B91_13255 [Planctomycetaceae bacterium]